MRSACNRSLFSNVNNVSNYRCIYNPVSSFSNTGTYSVCNSSASSIASNQLSILTPEYVNIIKTINAEYSAYTAEKQYEKIDNSYNNFITLDDHLRRMKIKTNSSNMELLIQFTQNALISSVNAFTLYCNNLELIILNNNLQKQITDMISGKNITSVETTNSSGQLSITKSFSLAPVFSYYFYVYGMPSYGVGFDPIKVNFLAGVLRGMGINPYQ